jgi:hypothetical protein
VIENVNRVKATMTVLFAQSIDPIPLHVFAKMDGTKTAKCNALVNK